MIWRGTYPLTPDEIVYFLFNRLSLCFDYSTRWLTDEKPGGLYESLFYVIFVSWSVLG